MPQLLSSGTENSSKRRKCIVCGHVNAPHALACDVCESVLTGSARVAGASPRETPPLPLDPSSTMADDEPTSKLRQRPAGERVRRLREEYPDIVESDHVDQGAEYVVDRLELEALHATGADLLRTIRVQDGVTERVPRRGTPVFEATMLLSLELIQDESPVVLRLPQQRPLVFGRDDPESGQRPDIDLVPYGAYHQGVSRHHAAIELMGKRLMVRDLSSVNGTFLNGVRLDPHDPHQVRDGDAVRMGNLTVNIYFNQ